MQQNKQCLVTIPLNQLQYTNQGQQQLVSSNGQYSNFNQQQLN
jgi:hypothetical protein